MKSRIKRSAPGTLTKDRDIAKFWGVSEKTITRWRQAGVNPADITAVDYMIMGRGLTRTPASVSQVLSNYQERLNHVRWEWEHYHDPVKVPILTMSGNGLTEGYFPGMTFVWNDGEIRTYIEQVGDDDEDE